MSVNDRVERADKEQIQVRARIDELNPPLFLFGYSLFFRIVVLTCVFWFLLRWSPLRQRITIFLYYFCRNGTARNGRTNGSTSRRWTRNSVIYECCDKEATNDHVVLRVVYSRWFSRLLFSDICSYSRNGLSRNSGNSCIHIHTHTEKETWADDGRLPRPLSPMFWLWFTVPSSPFSFTIKSQKRNPNRSKKESLPLRHHANRVFCVFVYIKCDWMFCLHRKLYKPWPRQQLPTKWITF